MNAEDRMLAIYNRRQATAETFIGPVPARAATDIFALTVYLVRAGYIA